MLRYFTLPYLFTNYALRDTLHVTWYDTLYDTYYDSLYDKLYFKILCDTLRYCTLLNGVPTLCSSKLIGRYKGLSSHRVLVWFGAGAGSYKGLAGARARRLRRYNRRPGGCLAPPPRRDLPSILPRASLDRALRRRSGQRAHPTHRLSRLSPVIIRGHTHTSALGVLRWPGFHRGCGCGFVSDLYRCCRRVSTKAGVRW